MGEITGQNLYVAFGGTELQADYRSLELATEVGLVDASAGSDANRTYLPTLKDGTAELTLVAQADGVGATAPRQLCAEGESGTLEWGPEGDAAGKPRRYVDAIVSSFEERVPYDDLVEFRITFQFSGELTNTVWGS
jgi:hypothetical protein